MTRRVVQRLAARADLRRTIEWIAGENPAAARRLVQAYTSLLQRIGTFPHSGRRYLPDIPSRTVIHFVPLPRFPNYLVFYHIHDDRVEIIRFLHGARDIPAILHEDLGLGRNEEE